MLHALTLDPLSVLDWAPGTLAESPTVFGLASDGEWAAGRGLVDSWVDWMGSVVLVLDKGSNWRTRNRLACPIQPRMRHKSMFLSLRLLVDNQWLSPLAE